MNLILEELQFEDAGIDAKITTNAVKKLTRGMASRIC